VLVNGVNPGDTAKPDLLMLVLVGGRERTLADFEPLARQAGLAVSTAARDRGGRFLVECRRA
jgi:2,7-dihydroxy-5-methyl-1-naphthoate 7-O-methyltransferase